MNRASNHKILAIPHGDKSLGQKECFEVEIVRALKKQSESSFNRLYLNYASMLLGVILKFVPSRENAEDILQETFIKIWKSIDQYDAEKGRLFTWMACLARNTAKDYLKGKNFAKSIKNDDIDSVYAKVNDFHYFRYNTDTIGVRDLVTLLSESQKQILDLVYFQGYTQLEASDELHIPLGTVKSKIRLAVKELRCYFV
ncbi:RNA polymerase sigma factor [Pedobacter sp. PAMC26386]|nr:RNA polymerase sigma factor [Pedobacter sp. PAMC26386]